MKHLVIVACLGLVGLSAIALIPPSEAELAQVTADAVSQTQASAIRRDACEEGVSKALIAMVHTKGLMSEIPNVDRILEESCR